MRRRFPIRIKLTFGALAPLFVAFFICSLTGLYIINAKIAGQAQEKVRTDLNSAREAYQHELTRIDELVDLTATAPFTAAALEAGNRKMMAALLTPLQTKKHLDILTAVDKNGRVLFRAHNPAAFGDKPAGTWFIGQALKGERITGTTVFSREQLAAEQRGLADRASIDVVPTPHARPGQTPVERSGMVLVSAAPVRSASGEIIGALYGAELLNNNNALVDKIKQTVYEGVQFKGQDVGTATIFLGDTRIATNVQTAEGKRAIGTRLSEEVYKKVILEKKKWVDRAFVVKDRYFTAYEPIMDLHGQAIGSLYVGMLVKPYTAMQRNVSLIFCIVIIFCSLIGLAVSGLIGAHLAQPIKELEQFARRVAVGERNLEVHVRTADELEDLAGEFNEMARALSRQESEISQLNRDLELKVIERTTQLEEKSQLLLKTQADLARAEKLADLGVVAAGVAHEINNPLAIIRGNTEVLEMCIPPEHPNREEIDIITSQTERMAKIVGNLLSFAQQKALHRGKVDIHRLLDDIVGQIGHQISIDAIRIHKDYTPLETISGDSDQLRQVFTNLILNAVQAMPKGGSLSLTTAVPEGQETCEVSITDTGPGILPEHREKIFTPFFTTKQSGSGLGLSVSYGIVKDHGGQIKVESAVGTGTTFRVILPRS